MLKINTEMPSSCADCFALIGDELHGYVCKLTGQTMKDAEFVKLLSKRGTLKMDKCPLQEDNSELKPCPFCGSEVKIKKSPIWREYSDGTIHGYKNCYKLEISCTKCGCSTDKTKVDTVNLTEDMAEKIIIKNWNERKKYEI